MLGSSLVFVFATGVSTSVKDQSAWQAILDWFRINALIILVTIVVAVIVWFVIVRLIKRVTENAKKKLLVADMESTMIHNEMLDELADFLGLREKIAGITARAMNGEIDFAGALIERVRLLKGLPVARLDEAAERIRTMAGAATLIATMHKFGGYCALVSGGFTYFTRLVHERLGFDFDAANTLDHDGRTLAGTVQRPILGKEAKLATLERLCAQRGLEIGQSISVGDGANDLPMLQAAGLGVAFRAKPTVAAQVAARIDHGDLTALLYLQGYRRRDFVERPNP